MYCVFAFTFVYVCVFLYLCVIIFVIHFLEQPNSYEEFRGKSCSSSLNFTLKTHVYTGIVQ